LPKLPGIHHQAAIRAFERAGFRVARQGKHVVMTDGSRILTIPRANPINAYTMGGLVKDAGLSIEEFRRLL
jgi:predicted RNA binding protein YcfA (HicA-like mRNA interferase family)